MKMSISRNICRQFLSVFIVSIFVVGFGNDLLAQQLPIPKCQIVIFTPSDVAPPPQKQYQARLQQFGEYAEEFFHEGLKQWEYEPKQKEIFERSEDGLISVVHVQSDLPKANDAFRKKWISRQVYAKLKSEHELKTAGNLYWIFVYVGDPPEKFTGFKGSGNSKDGGWGVVNYANVKAPISKGKALVTSTHNKAFLKGCIHEFGHGLGLPHIGPKVELGLGNTLMGPVTANYVKQKMPRKTKAYLSEASAAILSVHPLFSRSTDSRSMLPQTTFEDTAVNYDRKNQVAVVKGKLNATTQKTRRIIVIDDRDNKPGAYWVKAYVAKLDEESHFSISIPNPSRSGKLKLLTVYENGAVTGDGNRRGIPSAMEIPYSFK